MLIYNHYRKGRKVPAMRQIGKGDMRDAIQAGFRVLIIGIMMVNPLVACAAMFTHAPASAHGCCPAPQTTNCTMTVCNCATGESIQVVVVPSGESGEEVASLSRITLSLNREEAASGPKDFYAIAERYLAIHQFRI